MFAFEKSQVGMLLKRQPFPALGGIAWAVAGDIKWAPYRMPLQEYLRWHHDEYYPFLWELLDEKFGSRNDYRLWRLIAKPLYPSKYSAQWACVFDTALNALESTETVVVWGALAVLSGFLTSKRLRGVFPDESSRVEIAKRCEQRIYAGLAPVQGGEVGCALIKALAWGAVQQAQYEHGRASTLDDSGEFLDRIERSLGEADQDWKPGGTLRVGQALEREQASGRVVAPYDAIELEMRVAEALFKARAVARSTVRAFDERADQLLQRAALLAFSSWRLTRSLRNGEERFQRKNPTYVPKYKIQSLQRNEMAALKRLGEALRDAGYHLDAALAAWLLLTLLSDELLHDPEFRNVGTQLASGVRNAGLSIPARFARSREENRARAKHRRAKTPDGDQVSQRLDPLRLRLAEEKKTDARWREIQRLEAGAFSDVFGALARVVDMRKELRGDVAALRAAFGLARRYGRLREAAQVAGYLQLSENELLDLAHSIKRALQLTLFAADHDTHAEWRDTLRGSWTQLPNRWALSGDEILVLHEVLLGRYPSILRNAGPSVSRMIALKLYNQLDDEVIREFLDVGPSAFRRGPATVTIHRLRSSLQTIALGSLGRPVCVSVARLNDDSVSVIAVGSAAERVEEISLPGIRTAPADVRTTYSQWRLRSRSLNIPWHSSLRKLSSTIVQLVERMDPACRWLVLALEPDLASLPWTYMVSSSGARNLVVSLVPSLSWLAKAIEHTYDTESVTETLALKISCETDLSAVAERIKRDAGTLRRLTGSCGIVLGHGQKTDSGIPAVTMGSGVISLEEWLNLAAHRVLVVHSCHSGRVSQSLPSDLGGLPGVALSIGCRVFIAPVTEVSPGAAIALHDELAREEGPVEIGLRYLAATQRHSHTSLYNIYGLANEPLNCAAQGRPDLSEPRPASHSFGVHI
jgi:hypothetical protein